MRHQRFWSCRRSGSVWSLVLLARVAAARLSSPRQFGLRRAALLPESIFDERATAVHAGRLLLLDRFQPLFSDFWFWR